MGAGDCSASAASSQRPWHTKAFKWVAIRGVQQKSSRLNSPRLPDPSIWEKRKRIYTYCKALRTFRGF